MDEYHQYAGVAKTIGVDVKFLSPQQVKEIWPLCHTDDLIGAIQHPEDGYIQPADLTQALAAGATACSFGKAFLFSLGAGGQKGVERLLDNMQKEIRRNMILMGCKSVKDLDASKIIYRDYFCKKTNYFF